MDIYSIANCLTGFIEAYLVFVLFETFLKQRNIFSKYIYYIGIILLAVLINISNILFSISIGNLIITMILYVIFSYLYNGSIHMRIISSAISLMIGAITEVCILLLLSLIFNKKINYIINETNLRLLGIALSKIFCYAIIKYISLKFKRQITKFDIRYWILFAVVFSSTTLAMFTFFKITELNEFVYMRNLTIISSISLSTASMIVLFLYENTLKQKSLLSKQQMSEVQLKEQVKHYNDIMMTQGQVKKIRHDLKNHLLSIMAMIKSNDSEKCINYIKSLLENVDISNSYIDTGNIVLDAIISAKITEAEKKGIEFNSEIQIPSNLPISQEDECVIFGNALDNAIEAAIKVKDKKYINLSLIFNKDTLTCKISNSYDGNCNLITTKSDIRNHGLGKENIKKALEKYNSIARVIEENNEYILTFVLMGLKIN